MKTARFIALLAALSLLTPSCKKAVEEKQEDLLMSIIVSGVWVVESFTENGTSVTAAFSGYEFKFERNGTVTGTLSGVNTSGTWSGSTATNSITSNFPTAGAPLNKLNGTWIITDAGLNYVKAVNNNTSGTNSLYLYKKP